MFMTHVFLEHSQLSWIGSAINAQDAHFQLHGDKLFFQQADHDLNPEMGPGLNSLWLSNHRHRHISVCDIPKSISPTKCGRGHTRWRTR